VYLVGVLVSHFVTKVNCVRGHGGELINLFQPLIVGVDDYFLNLQQSFRLHRRILTLFFSDNQSSYRTLR